MRARFSISTFKAKKSSLWFQLFSIYLNFKVGSTTTSYCLVHSSETNQETKRKCKLFVSEQEKKERKVQHNLNSKRRLPHIFEPGKSFYSSAQIVHNVFIRPESNWWNVNVTFYFLLTKRKRHVFKVIAICIENVPSIWWAYSPKEKRMLIKMTTRL